MAMVSDTFNITSLEYTIHFATISVIILQIGFINIAVSFLYQRVTKLTGFISKVNFRVLKMTKTFS